MSENTKYEARIFDVDSSFQKMARRPGGVPREQAIRNAQAQIEQIKPGFDDWLDRELQELAAIVRRNRSGKPDTLWIERASFHSCQLRDVGTTMGYELLSFIANALCNILDAVSDGAKCNIDLIVCHVDALFLARQEQYRNLRPDQLPELSAGLRKVVELARASSPTWQPA